MFVIIVIHSYFSSCRDTFTVWWDI